MVGLSWFRLSLMVLVDSDAEFMVNQELMFVTINLALRRLRCASNQLPMNASTLLSIPKG